MKIDILTLFPNSFAPLKESIIGRAVQKNAIEINITDIREFSKDKHKRCDDYTFGGGEGMLMTPQPLFDSIESVLQENSYVIYLSPNGTVFSQKVATRLAEKEHLVFICGHYEGIDQRVIDTFVDEEISIGDYVLTGGELPSMVVVDAVCRLLPDVLGNANSALNETFSDNLLEFPQYTRPADFRGMKVPEVLLNGNHAEIAKWRKQQSINLTQQKRPDLLKGEEK
ncbi:MAG: tRNA (guanosine(37)-N1)-methyltransferase TrmD [Clostridia bacterium]|nr:tRNA (guanosine(37)-N1)-methyltransferase TrmD [Clostridia bacterium]